MPTGDNVDCGKQGSGPAMRASKMREVPMAASMLSEQIDDGGWIRTMRPVGGNPAPMNDLPGSRHLDESKSLGADGKVRR
jgi:hypothetical protein